ncbi:MAG TPA: FkbM family methyltransferase [Acidimicrobiales bacterium]|jgi:FkbM family methyltransferase|nr:FkbM family methyltransferase [Acidimicrobiales bacterium]
MKSLTRAIDRWSPSLSVRLRLLQKKARQDMSLAVIDHLVQPGDFVLDVGAYRGVYTLALSRRVGPGGKVWAIEPFPPNFAALEAAVGHRPNVRLVRGAASSRSDRRSLAVPRYQGHQLGALATLGRAPVASDIVEVDLIAVDDLLGGVDARDRVSFIRCDVVGHEAVALEGAARCIRNWHPAILAEIEQRHQETPIQATLDWLSDLGYDGYFLQDSRLVPLERFDLQRDQLAYLDTGFVPYGMPSGYVHYFCFVAAGTDVGGLVRSRTPVGPNRRRPIRIRRASR